MPNRISPPTPASAASTAALRRLSLVCWTTPGMDGTGTGSAIPSLTNSGSTRSEPSTLVAAASRRSAAVRRSLRGRTTGNPVMAVTSRWRPALTSSEPTAGAAPALAGLADRLTGRDGRVTQAGAVLGQRLGQRRGRGFRRHHIDPQPVLGGGLGGLGADHRDDRDRVRLAGDA